MAAIHRYKYSQGVEGDRPFLVEKQADKTCDVAPDLCIFFLQQLSKDICDAENNRRFINTPRSFQNSGSTFE